jgi:alpha-L-fucosidase 2
VKLCGLALCCAPALLAEQLSFAGSAVPPKSAQSLWWRRPAGGWTGAMPLGNGRLGAMVEGGVDRETVWLNEDTLWSGEPFEPGNPDALTALPEVRKLLVERKEAQAHELFNAKMLGPNNECYMPLGCLKLEFPLTGPVVDYRRTLDLANGVAGVSYCQAGVTYTREVFVSQPDQAVVMRFTADHPGKVSLNARLESLLKTRVLDGGGFLQMTGRCPTHADPHYVGTKIVYDDGANPKGMTFEADLMGFADQGLLKVVDGRLIATDCDAVTLVLVAATSYNGFDKSPSRQGNDPAALCASFRQPFAAAPDFDRLRQRHERDFSALMGRVALDLGPPADAARPTDERLGGGFSPRDLPSLAALYYQFGRYLLVSSSRMGTQPANLQGIWSRSLNPPWSANWTMNCNANFNYLGIEAANLSELHEPFIRLVKEWSHDGARTARTWYGCNGWVGHHNCDIWRNACPVGGNAVWAAFVSGGAWACRDLWEHYAFTLDKEYLRDVWPTLRGAGAFFLDYLIEDPRSGFLVTAPDTNFENWFKKPDGSSGKGLCLGPTPSSMMVRQLFADVMAASVVLDCDPEFRARLARAMAKLPPTKVDAHTGEIQEYVDVGYQVGDRAACELLTAWGLIWSDQLTPMKTPDLCAALRKSYEATDRQPWVTGQVGSWQGAFPANTYARLGDGDRVTEILARHFEKIVQPNFTAGFMQSDWEIDGNLGVMAAIGEMLLQSHESAAGQGMPDTTVVALLPSLPHAWKDGAVKGLKARGNITVDIEWQGGKVVKYRLTSPNPRPVTLRVNGDVQTITPEKSTP